MTEVMHDAERKMHNAHSAIDLNLTIYREDACLPPALLFLFCDQV